MQKLNMSYDTLYAELTQKEVYLNEANTTLSLLKDIQSSLEDICIKEQYNAEVIKNDLNNIVDVMKKEEVNNFMLGTEEEKNSSEAKEAFLHRSEELEAMKSGSKQMSPKTSKSDKKTIFSVMKKMDMSKAEQDDIIKKNLTQMSAWANLQKYKLIFDSSKYETLSNAIFTNKIFGSTNTYLLCFDDYGSVFGVFLKNAIDKIEDFVVDEELFLFTFKKGPFSYCKKWVPNRGEACGIKLNKSGTSLFQVGCERDNLVIAKPFLPESYCFEVDQHFENLAPLELNGTCFPKRFVATRICVLQFK
ncbi:hypothetical protein EIN_123270 [Entamoeba invadens IP1]|uniref:TLDc domain-containing protein n=1 Tax=Entamoeba invadens IP1 TaxID=370355 RepID=A0A0A1UEL1_ENTIV|nr:hypothetical protein EIN_123270 [Entamoeba invadens IP1]ELP92346.1 hypothetical protein EIN_123270 [Entamoeba invadens IP1]|eukprot:XP_004259117.1 hypothetical protein EIN_123270 [Entamoeba invadens IP1]